MKSITASISKYLNTLFQLKGENIEIIQESITPTIDVLPPITDFVNLSGGVTFVLPERFLLWGIHLQVDNADITGVCTSVNLLMQPIGTDSYTFAWYIDVGTATIPQRLDKDICYSKPILLEKGTQLRSLFNGNANQGQMIILGSYIR